MRPGKASFVLQRRGATSRGIGHWVGSLNTASMQDVVTDGETEAQRLEASGLTHGHAESWGQSSDNNVGLSLLPKFVVKKI